MACKGFHDRHPAELSESENKPLLLSNNDHTLRPRSHWKTKVICIFVGFMAGTILTVIGCSLLPSSTALTFYSTPPPDEMAYFIKAGIQNDRPQLLVRWFTNFFAGQPTSLLYMHNEPECFETLRPLSESLNITLAPLKLDGSQSLFQHRTARWLVCLDGHHFANYPDLDILYIIHPNASSNNPSTIPVILEL